MAMDEWGEGGFKPPSCGEKLSPCQRAASERGIITRVVPKDPAGRRERTDFVGGVPSGVNKTIPDITEKRKSRRFVMIDDPLGCPANYHCHCYTYANWPKDRNETKRNGTTPTQLGTLHYTTLHYCNGSQSPTNGNIDSNETGNLHSLSSWKKILYVCTLHSRHAKKERWRLFDTSRYSWSTKIRSKWERRTASLQVSTVGSGRKHADDWTVVRSK